MSEKTIIQIDHLALISLGFFIAYMMVKDTLDCIFFFQFKWTTHNLILMFCFIRSLNVGINYDIGDRPAVQQLVILGRKTNRLFDEFIRKSKVRFIGMHRIVHQSIGGVLHPVDNFIKHYFDRYFVKECAQAFATYKRTNPTLALRLNQLDRYGELNPISVTESDVNKAFSSILQDVRASDDYLQFKDECKSMVSDRNFEGLSIDMTSAAGYPYRQGTKRRDCHGEASHVADRLLDDDVEFDDYARDHVWYTTGRAKLQAVDKEPKGRLIMYAGFSFMMIAMLFAQPWARFMNQFVWCGVGMSWMHGGARTFATYMQASKGFAPKGFRYVSVDIKDWDTRINPMFFIGLLNFFVIVMRDVGIDERYISKFKVIFLDMLNARVLFPLGYLFKVFQGMKSGWCNTANDNTIIHECVFRIIMSKLGWIRHILYGDDNFMLVPDSITDAMIVTAYAECGLIVGRIHSSRYIGDVDFLSKHVMYKDGDYYIFRPTVESVSRILMPEELNPASRDKPDAVVAAERLLGHLIDNPFNSRVRNICYKLLKILRDKHGILYVDLDHGVRKRHPWRFFDQSKIPKRFPTVPNFAAIIDLYGVKFQEVSSSWPAFPEVITYDPMIQHDDSIRYDVVNDYSDDVLSALYARGNKVRRRVVRWLSPFASPKTCYGFHAARMNFAIKHFKIDVDSALDLGAHPGACAASLLDFCDDVTLVERDSRKTIPYAVGEYRMIHADADKYVPDRRFTLIHDDVDLTRARTRGEDLLCGVNALKRAVRLSKYCDYYMLTLKEFGSVTMTGLFEAYHCYGHIDFVKPYYSNPWKSEFMVLLRHVKGPRMRKNTLIRSVNGFLNSMAGQQAAWTDKLAEALGQYGTGDAVICPYQESMKIENTISFRAPTG